MKSDSQPKTYAMFASPSNRKLANELEKNGSKIFQFELLKTESVKTNETFENFRSVEEKFDWIVFSDVFSVDYFLEVLSDQEIDLYELDAIRVLAYGEAVTDRLRYVQLHADIITTRDETSNIFSALMSYIGESEIVNTSFFVPIRLDYTLPLSALLNESGAMVLEVPVYKTISNDKKETSKLKTLLKGGAIDEFIFTTPEDVFNLKNYILPETLQEILFETSVSATNEITISTLTENNLPAVKIKHKKRG